MGIKSALQTILGLTVVGAIVGVASCNRQPRNQNAQSQPPTQPTIVTHTHTNEYNVPTSLESSVGFHQDHTTQKVNANLFVWENKPYLVNTNDHAQPGELNFTLQALNNSTLVLNADRNTAFADSPIYVFVPVTNSNNGTPLAGWQFPTNGADKLSSTRTYLNTNLNTKHSGTAQGLEVRLNRPLEIATFNNQPYHVDNDLTVKTNHIPLTNALPFALVSTEGNITYRSNGHIEMKRKNNNPLVYRAVAVPQSAYLARTNQIVQTNAPTPSTGIPLEE
jgi:hypothetical protein